MNTDFLKNLSPVTRRWIRTAVAFGLAGLVSGLGLALQEVILPDLEALVGTATYQLLYTAFLGSLMASITAGSKWLRENKDRYLPF